ncbi:TPA: hypothetical protein HA241_07260 [Candidatus Woesearchaeota archaeon]|nr:hypothetical protein [Candidatus Woesearchaeota archaeon]
MTKKGSLSLSIQTIVIVVIAFVVLGLGLGFVRTQFKSITETSSSVQEQVRQQILEDLRTGNRPLSFPATTLNIEAKSSQDIAIGVKNTLSSGVLDFEIAIETSRKQGSDVPPVDQVEYFYDKGPFNLRVTQAEAYNIKILASGDKGTYLVNLKIVQVGASLNDPPYAEKSFFVNII